MKETFFEYYNPTKEEISAIWQECILVLDTNVLLNLYRYSFSTRDDILAQMRKFSDKLWMPYQIGWEYHNNRESVIRKTYALSNDLKVKISSKKEEFLNLFKSDYSRNPFLSSEAFEKKLNKMAESFVKFVEDKFKDAPDLDEDDIICKELDSIFDGKVGNDFNAEELNTIYLEGMGRYAAKVPPGYKDEAEKKSKGERHLYGDLIIWKEMIKYSLEKKKDIVFVSDDLKEDWLRIEKGMKKGPRRELLREFFTETEGQHIIILTQQNFLNFVHSLPEHTVKSSTMKEVKTDVNSVFGSPESMIHYWDTISKWRELSEEATKAAKAFEIGMSPLTESIRQVSKLKPLVWSNLPASVYFDSFEEFRPDDAEKDVESPDSSEVESSGEGGKDS